MRIGLAYDLKEDVEKELSPAFPPLEDALEEYDSAETVDAIASVLVDNGYSVARLGGGRSFLNNILSSSVDFVFNIAEGRGNYRSREAQVPSVLEMLGIPYSGSDPQCLSICLDKPLTKKMVAMSGVRTPKWEIISDLSQLTNMGALLFPLPAFVKPAYEGSSKGIRANSIARTTAQLIEIATSVIKHYQQPALIEEFIPGDDITVGIVGNSPAKLLGIMRVLPKENTQHFIYSLEMKRDWEQLLEYECPADLSSALSQQITAASTQIFYTLGCRDFARIDFRLGKDGNLYFLEINPLPGLNPKSSDLSIMANKMGLSYQHLILEILNSALERYPQCVAK